MTTDKISIIIPTITGREEWAERSAKSYLMETPGAEIIIIKDQISCGLAWNLGAAQATRDYLHFTADDITPHFGWWERAMRWIDQGIVPACNVRDRHGESAWCDSPLGDMGLWPNILVPFINRKMLGNGEWLLPVHYGSDDWVTYMAVKDGYSVQRCPEYKVIHHVAAEGRNYLRRYGDVKALAEAMEAEGYLPPVYRQLEINLRTSLTGLDSVRLSELDQRSQDQMTQQKSRAS